MDTALGHLVLRLRGLRDLLEHLRLQGRLLLRSLPRQEGPALAGRPEVQLRTAVEWNQPDTRWQNGRLPSATR